MVWGGVSYAGKTPLIILKGWQNAQRYQEMIKGNKSAIKKVFGRAKWSFQQDNAPSHKPEASKACIRKHLTKNIFPHPPQSPDLNPIELVWAKMKRLVQSLEPKNKKDLTEAILICWDKINLAFIRRCINNLKKKMKTCIEKNGSL